MKIFRLLFVILMLLMAGCMTPPISTFNSSYGKLYLTDTSKLMEIITNTVRGMKGYSIAEQQNSYLTIRYDPSNPFFGSATIKMQLLSSEGYDINNQKHTGIEIIMTDMTRWYSEDTSFSAGDIIAVLINQVEQSITYHKIDSVSISKNVPMQYN